VKHEATGTPNLFISQDEGDLVMKKVLLFSVVLSLLVCPLMTAQTPDDPDRGKDKKIVSFKCEIAAIDAAKKQITVMVKTKKLAVQVIKKTIIKDKTGKITFDDLKVGMTVFVKGQFKDKLLIAYFVGVK